MTETHRVCEEPIGSTVTIEGIIAIPRFVNIVYLTRGGAYAERGYQLTVSDRFGKSANVTVWTTDSGQPNRIQTISGDAGTNDLRLFSNSGHEIGPGQAARITGVVVQDPTGCTINAEMIETAKGTLKETP